ncbi:hypothetical protein ABTE98_19530, partial [Acinetobacter baumannii]
FALGTLYLQDGKYSSASGALGRALRLAERSSGAYSVSLVPFLDEYANAQALCGRRGESAALRARARRIDPQIPQLAVHSAMKLGA